MKPIPPSSLQNQPKILLISDEPVNAEVWGFSLNQIGMEIRVIGLTDPIMEVWAEETPDLIVIEDFNEKFEELEVIRQLREVTVAPILFLTCKTNEFFHYKIYEAGADDCIPFPITPRLFQAKVKAWLRWSTNMPFTGLDEVPVGDFRLNTDQKRLTLPTGDKVRLTILETRLLYLLMSHPGKIFEGDEIVKKVWGHYGSGDGRLLKNHIYRLRKKIEPDPAHPRYLTSEGYAGYKFQADPTEDFIS